MAKPEAKATFEPALGQIEKFAIGDLQRIVAEIPGGWYGNDQNAMRCLIEALDKRRAIVCNLIAAFRDCPREPFPNCELTFKVMGHH